MPVALQPKGSKNKCPYWILFLPKNLAIHIKSPDLTFYKPPPDNSVLPRTFTLHTNTCQASKLKQNELCYAVALLVFGDFVLSFQENLSLFSPRCPPIFVVQALKAHWKAALSRCECVCEMLQLCCSLPLGTSCYAANGPSAALARVGCPNTEA